MFLCSGLSLCTLPRSYCYHVFKHILSKISRVAETINCKSWMKLQQSLLAKVRKLQQNLLTILVFSHASEGKLPIILWDHHLHSPFCWWQDLTSLLLLFQSVFSPSDLFWGCPIFNLSEFFDSNKPSAIEIACLLANVNVIF